MPKPFIHGCLLICLAACAFAFAPPAAAADAAPPKILRKVPPEFPEEASRKSISTGAVRARLSVDAAGAVTEVNVLEAQPPRVFDKATISALRQWKFEPAGKPLSFEIRVVFQDE